MVGERSVLTVAHNCYNKRRKEAPKAEKVYFIPDADGKDIEKGRIKAAACNLTEKYEKCAFSDKEECRRNDYAFLVLEEKVPREKYLKIVSSACTQLAKTIDIITCGFPTDKMQN